MEGTFTCTQCGESFDNRSDLGKHLAVHRRDKLEKELKEERILIPTQKLEELQYVANGHYARVFCDGVMTPAGLMVHDIGFVR